jgi:dTDP-4-dehydrorhamnose reductase
MAFGSVAITGPGGRLGRALVGAVTASGGVPVLWGRPQYDLDSPEVAAHLFERDRPDLVIHAAAWTDVDGCAREPQLALRRNGAAVGELATQAAALGKALVVISTNEVFDGRRDDGAGYTESDQPAPINSYGQSKLIGEQAARDAFSGGAAPLWIVRTSWLYGPPGADFPAKILAAESRLEPDQALRVVADEFGSPTYTSDLAAAVLDLAKKAPMGTYHLVSQGHTSRAGWAGAVLEAAGRDRMIEPISQREFKRASVPPAWGVLDTSAAQAFGISLPAWETSLAGYLAGTNVPR